MEVGVGEGNKGALLVTGCAATTSTAKQQSKRGSKVVELIANCRALGSKQPPLPPSRRCLRVAPLASPVVIFLPLFCFLFLDNLSNSFAAGNPLVSCASAGLFRAEIVANKPRERSVNPLDQVSSCSPGWSRIEVREWKMQTVTMEGLPLEWSPSVVGQ